MIIEIERIPFAVEHECDDDDIYISSAKLHGYELVNIISQEWLDAMLSEVIEIIKQENEESKYENAIDDYQNRWVEL